MDIDTLDLEARLKQRYAQLVEAHSAPTSPIAAGLRALPSGISVFAAAQAAWRFYANEKVTLPKLMEPVIAHVCQQIASVPPQGAPSYVLVVHDWCWLQYSRHTKKQDRLHPKRQKACGYELGTALVVSAQDGAPVGPLSLDLVCAEVVHTSRSEQPQSRPQPHRPDPSEHIEQLRAQIEHVEPLAHPTVRKQRVHIVDREVDSVALYRALCSGGRQLVIRTRDHQRVVHQDRSRLLCDLPAEMEWHPGQPVLYQGKQAYQYVAETHVLLTRPASNGSHHHANKKPVAGPPVLLRLVVSEIRDAAGKKLARWYLYTNVSPTVSAEQIATWYFWRWRIECFFKLLKSAGWNIEEWQQESGAAIAKRLAVVCMAAVLVWSLQQSAQKGVPEAQALCQELVRLSGRQMKRSRPVTAPALLAGLWTLLAVQDLLHRYTPEQLNSLLEQLSLWCAYRPPGLV